MEEVFVLPGVGDPKDSAVSRDSRYEDLAAAIVLQAMKDAVGLKEDNDKTPETWEKIKAEAIKWLETNEDADWYSNGNSKRAAKECREHAEEVKARLLELEKDG